MNKERITSYLMSQKLDDNEIENVSAAGCDSRVTYIATFDSTRGQDAVTD